MGGPNPTRILPPKSQVITAEALYVGHLYDVHPKRDRLERIEQRMASVYEHGYDAGAAAYRDGYWGGIMPPARDQNNAPVGTVATIGHPSNSFRVVKTEAGWISLHSGDVIDEENFRMGWTAEYIPTLMGGV